MGLAESGLRPWIGGLPRKGFEDSVAASGCGIGGIDAC